MAEDVVGRLRAQSCTTGPRPGHRRPDCLLHHQAAREIERLRSLIIEWADADDSTDEGSPVKFAHARWALRQEVGR